ncbi:OmpA family protein [Mariniflexile maritimum]|jgi:chemotaxis protein MotB|uniref:OmpA family protein n=1 Tax=Mariniflexile maritimum TaxID=2682493 RepID=UPI0012F6748E|nr:OmpA family protein [Mariniflexile maritimum]MCB0450231.1 OmpA family protein [Confluentibacter sp.]HMQ45083.1 OmpA family protein [Mariniflexile sp.]
MRKIVLLSVSAMFLLSACVSKKQFTDLEAKQKETQDLLNSATVKLNACIEDKASASARATALEEQIADLRKNNDNLQILSAKGASNIEKTLESIKEKDMKISRLQDALTKKDSITLAVVTSLKREVGINDPDIEINVEKGVVFISISDKLLFQSGSYNVTSKAKEVLAKVAKVVNGKPDFECMVEGHTDNVPYASGVLLDNWDLSVKRSTSIIRVLQTLGVKPSQLIAAGRADYVPLVENNSAENRAKNRRTRIVVLPKIDQFYDMVEKEMKNLSAKN